MDFTPISVGRVLAAFGLTVIVGVMPILAIVVVRNPLGSADGFGSVVLGLGSIAVVVTFVGVSWLAVAFGRRVVGRPSRV